MKKLAGILAAALLMTLSGAALAETVYEAEDAVLHGKNTVTADAAAYGGKVVGRFESDEDTLDFLISIPEDGTYDLTFICRGIGGGKTNKVSVDGKPQGEFTCPGTDFSADTVRGVLLNAGAHTVTVSKSWGWIWLDSMTVTPAAKIPDSVYDVKPVLANPNTNEDAQKLFS